MSADPGSPAPAAGAGGLAGGATAFFRGIDFLLRHPRLIPLVIAPIILTAVLYVALAIVAVHYFGGWLEGFFADKTAWYWTWTGAKYFAWLMFVVLMAAAFFFTFVAAGSLVAIPFNEVISQKIEAILLPGGAPPAAGILGFLEETFLSASHTVLRLAIFWGLLVACLPVLFVPLIGQVGYAVLSGYITSRYLAWEGLDACMSRRRWSFSRKAAFLREHRTRTLGFGLSSFLLLLVPLMTLFVLPLAATGGTILFCEIARGSRAGIPPSGR